MRDGRETAILDACVLYPAEIRDLLLYLAKYRFYDAKWTSEILRERERALRTRRKDLSESQITSATFAMNEVFPGALVKIDPTISPNTLPDVNDLHVLVGAMSCQATVIVTLNLKDFPMGILSRYGIRAEHPDTFCAKLIKRDQRVALAAFLQQVSNLKRPAMSPEQIVKRLAKLRMLETAGLLKGLLN